VYGFSSPTDHHMTFEVACGLPILGIKEVLDNLLIDTPTLTLTGSCRAPEHVSAASLGVVGDVQDGAEEGVDWGYPIFGKTHWIQLSEWTLCSGSAVGSRCSASSVSSSTSTSSSSPSLRPHSLEPKGSGDDSGMSMMSWLSPASDSKF
jgi:hypothetical protein